MKKRVAATGSELRARIEELESRLEEAEEVLRALREREVDALIVDGSEGEQVFTLKGADHAYRILFETMGEGAVTIAPDETILYCNRRFAEIVGRPLERVMGVPLSSFVMPGHLPFVEELCNNGEGGSKEIALNAADGSEIPVQVSARRAWIDGREIICIVATDLTEQKKSYAELQKEIGERKRIEKELRQAQKMEAIGTLAGGIAHDFNNILAAIIGFANIMVDQAPVGSRLHHNAERVFKAGLRGRELVKQILTFARQTEVDRKPVQLGAVVKEITKLLRPSMPSTVDVRFTVIRESGTVLADPGQMEQVVINLCTNAIHAMKEKGTVTIEVSGLTVDEAGATAPFPGLKPGRYASLSVTDTGHGISPEIIDRIFGPFFTTKRPGEGTGLGLSVAHGIVESHGGTIAVRSEPGKGSTFTVYLPTLAEEKAPVLKLQEGENRGGHERILFVDDEEALVEMGEELLRELGYEVTAKTDPREALALFKDQPGAYDCVITDQTMPDMTGLELAREIIALKMQTPIILCTGFSHLVNQDIAKAEGISGFVMKPLTRSEIDGAIRKVLDERRKRGAPE